MLQYRRHGYSRPITRALVSLGLLTLVVLLPSFQSHADNAGYALRFDGVNDVVALPETQYVMGSGWQSTKTVSLWIRPSGAATTCANNSVGWCDSVLGDRPRWWGISRGVLNGQDRVWVWNYDGSADSPVDVIGIAYTSNAWMHVSLVHGGGVLRAYLNGVELASTPSGETLQPTTGALPRLYLGGVINSTTRNWTYEGQIDEVSLWGTARTPAEVQQDMLRILSGTEAGLAAYYGMSNGSGTALTDDGPASWDGVLLDGMSGVPPNGGGPQWVASDAFGTGGSTPTATPTPTATMTASPMQTATSPPPTTSTNTPTAGQSPSPTATVGAPPPGVLDTFNRPNGAIGSGWSGNTGAYRVAENMLDVVGNGSIFWNSASFGADQEAYVSLSAIDPNPGTTSLLLKSQSSTTATAGVIRLIYSSTGQTVQVWTYAASQGWVQRGSAMSVAFASGDRFGARARADGWIEVLRNGAVVGSRDASAWPFSGVGGYIGVWMANASNALLDDFGGATMDAPISLAVLPTASPTASATPTPVATDTPTPEAATPTASAEPTSTETSTPTQTP